MTAATHIGGPIGSRYTPITTAATTVIKAAPGVLRRIVVNKAIAAGTITIYDHASAASGTKIATITFPATLLASQDAYEFNAQTTLGITIATVEANDITVIWD